MIREVRTEDAGQIARIYNHFVLNTVVTFEEEPVSDSEMESRIAAVSPEFPWVVFQEDQQLLGYAYAKTWQVRCAYRYSLEISIYLDPGESGKGIGSALYQRLLDLLRERGTHAVIAGISLPNPGSVALHEKFGFTKVAHYKEVGRKFDRWIDVGYWQLIL